MGRDVDERKKRAALRKLRKAAAMAEQGLGPPLSDWEKQFLEEVEERIETYGSAFADPLKGNEGEALSSLQQMKLKEIDKKARGKARKSFGGKKKSGGFNSRPTPRVRQLDEDLTEEETSSPAPEPSVRGLPKLVKASDLHTANPADPASGTPDSPPARPRPAFRVIDGGKQGG